MTKIELEIHDDIVTTLNKIKDINDTGIEILIPAGSLLFENVLNLKLLQKEMKKLGKVPHFETEDELGDQLIGSLNDKPTNFYQYKEIDDSSLEVESPKESKSTFIGDKPNLKLSIPSALPKLPNLGSNWIVPASALVIVGSISILAYTLFWKMPKAYIKIKLQSQPLVKSVTIKIKKNAETNIDQNILKGFAVSTSYTGTKTITTTGEKPIGKAAKGSITIYNWTTKEKTLKKGTTLIYTKDDIDYKYLTTKEVTVPARTDEATDKTPGEVSVDIEAGDIGEKYNISDDKTLEFKDYDKDDYIASTKSDISGGESKIIKYVTADDLKNLSTALLAENKQQAQEKFGKTGTQDKTYLRGSEILSIESETYSHKVNDETDSLELTQVVNVTGLAYSNNDLNTMLRQIIINLIPEGYKLYSDQLAASVETLGASDTTVLTSEEADIQATIKTKVIPNVDIEPLKNSLAGKNIPEAQKLLGGKREINSYELKVSPALPFFRRVPTNSSNINIEVITLD